MKTAIPRKNRIAKGILLALATSAVGFSGYSIAAPDNIKTDPFRKKAEEIVATLDVEVKDQPACRAWDERRCH